MVEEWVTGPWGQHTGTRVTQQRKQKPVGFTRTGRQANMRRRQVELKMIEYRLSGRCQAESCGCVDTSLLTALGEAARLGDKADLRRVARGEIQARCPARHPLAPRCCQYIELVRPLGAASKHVGSVPERAGAVQRSWGRCERNKSMDIQKLPAGAGSFAG